MKDWLAQGLPLEEGEVSYSHRNLSSENYSFSNGSLQFCDINFVKQTVSQLKEK